MIRRCVESDFDRVYAIINDAAQAYRGVIPDDCWHEPYMERDELAREIQNGVVFWGEAQAGQLVGVMGIQDRQGVTLIRHAYIRTEFRRCGVGSRLLRHLETMGDKPLLIGTWADATWAITFYQKHGYRLVSDAQKDSLLRKYWSIPARQIDTSVVLAGASVSLELL